jgi:hypothetical protein
VAHTDDVAGGGLRLVVGQNAGMQREAIALAKSGIGGTVRQIGGASGIAECDSVARDWMIRHQASHAFVRPDNIVFGVASSEETALAMIKEAQIILSKDKSIN